MRTEREPTLRPRMQAAIEELKGLVRERYPEATFRIARSPENPRSIHLMTTVDVEDRDDVMDVVIDRVVELQSEQKLPIHVIPVRPAARNEAIRRAIKQATPAWRKQLPPIQP